MSDVHADWSGVKAAELTVLLRRYLSFKTSAKLLMTNTILPASPWEADCLTVMGSLCWHEYEVKVSVADYKADFRKRLDPYLGKDTFKHDFYASKVSDIRRYGGLVPKPATFTFVTPPGLLDGVEIPDHCGLLELDNPEGSFIRHFKTVKKSPRLKGSSKLNAKDIMNLGMKLSSECVRLEQKLEIGKRDHVFRETEESTLL